MSLTASNPLQQLIITIARINLRSAVADLIDSGPRAPRDTVRVTDGNTRVPSNSTSPSPALPLISCP